MTNYLKVDMSQIKLKMTFYAIAISSHLLDFFLIDFPDS